MKQILVTDSLFIFEKHEKQLKDAGFEVVRLNEAAATEDQLVAAIQGKSGYILGGMEKVTNKVIEAADELEVIVFTGADWRNFIPDDELATKKGIKITNCPGANSKAVAEFAVALMLAMTRNLFELGQTGKKTFETTNSISDLSVGIVGLGNIGQKVVKYLQGLEVKKINYFSRTRKPDVEKELGISYVPLEKLLGESDIVSLHASKEAGSSYFGKEQFAAMKDGALLVDTSFDSAVDRLALLSALKSGKIRATLDHSVDKQFDGLPLNIFFHTNTHTAFNTHEASMCVSDMATESIINVLKTGADQYIVNES